jgi:hypothetical protein
MRRDMEYRRARRRERLQAHTDRFRRTHHPVARAQGWLDTGLRFEAEGAIRVAAAYLLRSR